MVLIIIVFIAILTLVILVHELGHFFAARSVGIKVEEFGIGFPPRLIKIKRKGTIFSINAIPLGGFVRMLGEEEESKNKNSFSEKSISQRLWVLVSGVLANFVLAILIFAVGFSIGMPLVGSNPTDHPYAKKIQNEVRIMGIKQNSPADKAGLVSGDLIISIDGKLFKSTAEVSDYTKKMTGKKVNIIAERNGQSFTKIVTLDKSDAPLGISPLVIPFVSYNWYQSPYAAIMESGRIVKATVLALGGLLSSLVVRLQVPQEVAGPVGIFFLTSEIIKLGWRFVLAFIAFLSLSIGIINILPFPALDGGRIVFLAIEKIRGKRVSPKIENITHLVGFAILIALIIIVSYYDIMRFR